MIEYWVYVYQDFLGGWETYGVYSTREEALSVNNLLTKWKKQCKITTTYDF